MAVPGLSRSLAKKEKQWGRKLLLKAGKKGWVAGGRDWECRVVHCFRVCVMEEKGEKPGLQPPVLLHNLSG